MPLSQGPAGGRTGLTLKAWVLMTAAGVVIRSFNVAGVAKGVTGFYTVTFATPMASTEYLPVFTGAGANMPQTTGYFSTRATGSTELRTQYISGGSNTNADVGGLWEFYE